MKHGPDSDPLTDALTVGTGSYAFLAVYQSSCQVAYKHLKLNEL